MATPRTRTTVASSEPADAELGSAAQRDRRKRILDATLALASKGGYDAVQMRTVAQRADVALGTLYRYFPSKIHLLVSGLAREFERTQEKLDRTPIPGETPYDRMLYVLGRITRSMQREPMLTEAMTRAFMFADPSAAAEVNTVARLMEHMLTKAMHDGEPSGDDGVCAHCVRLGVGGAAHEARRDGRAAHGKLEHVLVRGRAAGVDLGLGLELVELLRGLGTPGQGGERGQDPGQRDTARVMRESRAHDRPARVDQCEGWERESDRGAGDPRAAWGGLGAQLQGGEEAGEVGISTLSLRELPLAVARHHALFGYAAHGRYCVEVRGKRDFSGPGSEFHHRGVGGRGGALAADDHRAGLGGMAGGAGGRGPGIRPAAARGAQRQGQHGRGEDETSDCGSVLRHTPTRRVKAPLRDRAP